MKHDKACADCKHRPAGYVAVCIRDAYKQPCPVRGTKPGPIYSCWAERKPHRWWHRRPRCGLEGRFFERIGS